MGHDADWSHRYINETENKQAESPGSGLERSDQLQGYAAAAVATHVNYINAASCLYARISTPPTPPPSLPMFPLTLCSTWHTIFNLDVQVVMTPGQTTE